uniref:Uncharacterized protein n=1 Tax=Echinococcus granulosus TaxID=6210 RepID=A0A068WDL4_ECHGR|nr:hypothetical protein EgrG_000811600 [Echinococcus granulosus]
MKSLYHQLVRLISLSGNYIRFPEQSTLFLRSDVMRKLVHLLITLMKISFNFCRLVAMSN